MTAEYFSASREASFGSYPRPLFSDVRNHPKETATGDRADSAEVYQFPGPVFTLILFAALVTRR